jgi:hypothetical protein
MGFRTHMAQPFKSWDVAQLVLLPSSAQELVPEGHRAPFVRDMVRASLDLSAMLKSYTEDRGVPPYDPTIWRTSYHIFWRPLKRGKIKNIHLVAPRQPLLERAPSRLPD